MSSEGLLGTETRGVRHTIKVGESVNQVEVLEQQRSNGAWALPARRIVNGRTTGSGVDRLLIVPKSGSWRVVGRHFGGWRLAAGKVDV